MEKEEFTITAKDKKFEFLKPSQEQFSNIKTEFLLVTIIEFEKIDFFCNMKSHSFIHFFKNLK